MYYQASICDTKILDIIEKFTTLIIFILDPVNPMLESECFVMNQMFQTTIMPGIPSKLRFRADYYHQNMKTAEPITTKQRTKNPEIA